MSIFKSLKGTFKNVQGDISEGLKTLTASPEKTPTLKHAQTFLVNFEAGGELMHKHEEMWKDLYQYSEETAKKAQEVDVDVGKLYVACDKQAEVYGKLHQEAANLPVLLNQLQELTNLLAAVEEEYDMVEAALVYLEDLCEQQEFLANQQSHHQQLAVYKMKKDHEIQKYRATLAKEHAMKVEAVKKKKQQTMKEKQSAYEEQFTQEVDYYKKHGKLGRLPSTPESQKKLDLSDVEIEEEADKGALDAFLEAPGGDNTDQDEKAETETDPDMLSDGDGPMIEITGEITSPSEAETPSVASPEQIEPNSESYRQSEEADTEQPSTDVKSSEDDKFVEDKESSIQEEKQVDSKDDS